MITCPLCQNQEISETLSDRKGRSFGYCNQCHLVFVGKQFLPSREAEEKRYRQHRNNINDQGYVQFLKQAIDPAVKYITEDMAGLDYGCGPNPTLSKLLMGENLHCKNYDPIFFSDLPEGPFDFIFATECFEHFFDPAKEILQIKNLLKSSGILVIMTDLWSEKYQFADWYYSSDFTHVTFYHADTFEFIAEKFGFEVIYNDKKRVVILRNHSVC
ncbi:MAG TPA: class I SAM-dependent methyltransferase [Prolixibacteraceae bacterium]|nr:class I SAM-dependent methyltransferase [Prolixibacteraceae bacterium]